MAQSLTFESVWHPAQGATPGFCRLALRNRGGAPVSDFVLCLSAPARLAPGARLEGGRLIHQLSNYTELAPDPGFVLAPGAAWTLDLPGADYPVRHWTEGPTAAFVRLGDGTIVPLVTPPTRRADDDGPLRRGTMRLDASAALVQPVAITPWPRAVEIAGYRSVPSGFAISGDDATAAAFKRLTELLFPGEGLVRRADEGGWPVRLGGGDPTLSGEAYALSWTPDSAEVRASTAAGLLYGVITLAQMQCGARREAGRFLFPASGQIADAPEMAWRGCHLDVARRFYAAGEIARFLAILSWNKLNVFHWHLADDEAFRVEIDAYPELTHVAAWGGHGLAIPPLLGSGPERNGGFYRKETVRELVRLAQSFAIDVVPEIDIPGHCYAMLQALPQLRDPGETGAYLSIQGFPNNCLNPAVEAVYPVLETVIGELTALFPSRYFHVGADEVPADAWSGSPLATALGKRLGTSGASPLQAHFLRRVQAMVSARGRITGAWEEAAAEGGVGKTESYLVGWHNVEASQRLAAAGYDVVVSPGQAYYLDMANAEDWAEPGAAWAGWSSPERTYAFDPSAGWSATERKRLMGVQACIWNEPMSDPAVFDRLVFPRLSAIAETGWTAPDRKDFARFSAMVGLMPNLYGCFEAGNLAVAHGFSLGPQEVHMEQQQKPKTTDGAPAFKDGKKPGPASSEVQVRESGAEAQGSKPKKWDKQDEAVDESFPASDPPANY